MPTLQRFDNARVVMYLDDHPPPHVHVRLRDGRECTVRVFLHDEWRKVLPMSEYFFPKLEAVEALEPYRLRTTWSTGEALEVDVGDILRKLPALAPILDPEVFARVHVAEWGGSIEWFDTEFGEDNVYAWAKEQAGEVSHEMFGEWMHRNGLSLTTAAEALGISRRMVSYYRTAHKAIPRAIWLACLGWEATQPKANTLPRHLPTAREYAAAHN